MKIKDLSKIARITELQFQRDHQIWTEHTQRRQDLESTIARLEESRSLRQRDAVEPGIQKQAFLWGRWVDQTQANVNNELFSVVANEEYLLQRLKNSYGKHLAIDSIRETSARNRKDRTKRDP